MKKFTILLTSICGFSLSLSGAVEIDRDVDPVAYHNYQHLITLQKQLQMAEEQLEKQENGQRQLRKLRSSLIERRRELQRLRAQRNEVRRSLKNQRDEFSNYHKEVKIAARAQAQGEKLSVLQVPGGRSFQEVTIREVNDIGLVITHRDGRARVAFSELSSEFRERFFYDPELAAENIQSEREAEHQRSSFIAARLTHQQTMAAKKAKDEAYRAAIGPVSSESRSRSYSSSKVVRGTR